MIVYLDIIFFENVLMNYIIIFTTGMILKNEFKRRNVLLASCIGAIYSILMYLNILKIISNFIMKIILSIVIIKIAFNPKKRKTFFKYLLIFYLVSFIFGGCIFALMYIVKPQYIQIRNGVFVGTYPIKIAIAGGIVAYVVTQISFKMIKTKINKKDMIYTLEIFYKEKSIQIHGMLDTGNLLKDPITGTPVIIVQKDKLLNLFSQNILNNIEKILGGDVKFTIDEEEIFSKVRILPFSSIGNENGMLVGIKVDYINILIDETSKKMKDVIIGIYNKKITKNDEYSAIFGLDILK